MITLAIAMIANAITPPSPLCGSPVTGTRRTIRTR
jgi:hypothetical protein